ncbi:MAG: alpha/beta fold hydrolase [Stigonema ocellatum SAG 48.90 = DSM 106950]|nr:alpha/beta fold hydrolase [Stigonema ocellatum SAG 48.90 = DSM 106950]
MPVEHRSYNTSNGSLPYLFSSATANANKPAPVVVFLHGGRDRGTDLNILLKWGFPRFVDLSASLPYFFVAPQIPAEQTWVDRESDVLALLDELIASEAIDPLQVILAGFSLGTAGAWHIASVNPGRFAGLVAVSGRVPKTLEPTQLAALKNIPIQIFQGGQDQNLSVEDAENFVKILREQGATVEFTVLPDGDHFIADTVYSDPTLQQWLVSLNHQATVLSN